MPEIFDAKELKFRIVQPIRGELGSERINLRLTMYGLRRAQDKLNELRGVKEPIYATINREIRGADEFQQPIDFINVMFWAACLEEKPDVALEDVERKLFDPTAAWAMVLLLIQRAFFGEKDHDDIAPLPTTEAEEVSPLSDGENSGASPVSH